MPDCIRRAVSGSIMQKKKPVRLDSRAGFRAVWGSIIFQRGEFFQRLGDGLALLHLVNALAQGFHVGRLIEWLGRVFRAGWGFVIHGRCSFREHHHAARRGCCLWA